MDVLSLTRRESQLVQLLCLGYTDQQAARQMGIKVCTFDNYRTRTYRKLRVTSRTAAVTVYLAHVGRTVLKQLAAQATYSPEVAACEW